MLENHNEYQKVSSCPSPKNTIVSARRILNKDSIGEIAKCDAVVYRGFLMVLTHSFLISVMPQSPITLTIWLEITATLGILIFLSSVLCTDGFSNAVVTELNATLLE